MNLEEIRNQILSDTDFVLEETKRIQYIYGLKYEIRYGLTRATHDYTESVAEHIYGMHVLSDYFLNLEDPESKLDREYVRAMITWHDMDELETGDKISWQKTDAEKANEAVAWKGVIPYLPESLQQQVTTVVEDYEALGSPEARFVKAIDKVEPVFQLYTDLGKQWSLANGLTRHHADRIKTPYVKDYPFIKRFIDVLHNKMEVEGWFAV